jgi:hypothetical protein
MPTRVYAISIAYGYTVRYWGVKETSIPLRAYIVVQYTSDSLLYGTLTVAVQSIWKIP